MRDARGVHRAQRREQLREERAAVRELRFVLAQRRAADVLEREAFAVDQAVGLRDARDAREPLVDGMLAPSSRRQSQPSSAEPCGS